MEFIPWHKKNPLAIQSRGQFDMVVFLLRTNPKRPKAYLGLRVLGTGAGEKLLNFITGDSVPELVIMSRLY